MKKILYSVGAVLVVGLLVGCASKLQQYSNTLEKNLTVNLNLADKGGFLTTVTAYAGINEIARDCTNNYLGFVDLTDGANKIGVALGKPVYLIVEVSRSRHGNNLSFKRGTMITPAAGKQYDIDANYADGMFDFRFYEATKAGRKELPIVLEVTCKQSK